MFAIISASNVTKAFRQTKRLHGLVGAMASPFSRQFAEVHAAADISFAIAAGEEIGYLGPSGGSLSVLGREPHSHRMLNAAEIGVVFGRRSQL